MYGRDMGPAPFWGKSLGLGTRSFSIRHTIYGDNDDRSKFKVKAHPLQLEDGKKKMEDHPRRAAAMADRDLEKELDKTRGRWYERPDGTVARGDPEPEKGVGLGIEWAKDFKNARQAKRHQDFKHGFTEFIRGNGTPEEYERAGMHTLANRARAHNQEVGQGNAPANKQLLSQGAISTHPEVLEYIDAHTKRVIDYQTEQQLRKLRHGRTGPYGQPASLDELWKLYKYVVHGLDADKDEYGNIVGEPPTWRPPKEWRKEVANKRGFREKGQADPNATTDARYTPEGDYLADDDSLDGSQPPIAPSSAVLPAERKKISEKRASETGTSVSLFDVSPTKETAEPPATPASAKDQTPAAEQSLPQGPPSGAAAGVPRYAGRRDIAIEPIARGSEGNSYLSGDLHGSAPSDASPEPASGADTSATGPLETIPPPAAMPGTPSIPKAKAQARTPVGATVDLAMQDTPGPADASLAAHPAAIEEANRVIAQVDEMAQLDASIAELSNEEKPLDVGWYGLINLKHKISEEDAKTDAIASRQIALAEQQLKREVITTQLAVSRSRAATEKVIAASKSPEHEKRAVYAKAMAESLEAGKILNASLKRQDEIRGRRDTAIKRLRERKANK